MPSPEKAELQRTVDELTAATRKGSFEWRAVNPTTYIWERPANETSPGAKITLQRVDKLAIRKGTGGHPEPVRKSDFMLQVHETVREPLFTEFQLKLSISGSDDPEINAKLEDLYELISSGYSEEGVAFLKRLIGGPRS